MGNETHMVKVYEADWKALNTFLSMLQIEKGERLSFADVIHEIVTAHVMPQLEKWENALARREL